MTFTGLVQQVIRLVDEFERDLDHKVSFIFFENSSYIRHRGLPDLVEQLKARKFNCIWYDVSAAGIGARHVRKRWFMLATRVGAGIRAPRATVFKHNFDALDILVNNAGIFPFKPFMELTEADWDNVLDVNLKSVFLCSQAAAKVMKDGSKIVSISSIASFEQYKKIMA